jgi:hypothetical protein
MVSTTYPYHVVLVPITRGGLKRRIPHGDTKYLLGTVVELIQI